MSKQRLPLFPYPAAYFERGQGQVLVFLHGFLGEAANWSAVIDHLPDFRCIAIDLLGFGDSAKPDLQYTIWHQVEFLQQVLAALGTERFYLVGHSYGGWTAAAYTIASYTGKSGLPGQQYPFVARSPLGLGLVAPAGIRDDQFVGRYAHLRPLLWETPWVDRGLQLLAPLSRLLGQQDSLAQICQIRQALLQQPVAKSFLRDRLRPDDAIDTVETQLSEITIPTVVVAAAADETIPLWHCQTYAKGIFQSQYHLLTEAGHDLIQTHAAEIAQQLRQLVALQPEHQHQVSKS
jgi:pimeloyl-ACP methyl ester carboxylesterase